VKYDRDKLQRLTSELLNSLEILRRLKEVPKEKFLTDSDKIGNARYRLIVAIEAMIDICNHLISKNSFRAPEDYADTFRVMKEREIFDEDFFARLVEMVKFRNRLVHLYWNVNDEIVFEILQNNLEDFQIFLDKISEALSGNEAGHD
jgi:uncharacterized protein YutE (UPF0331/DUF86 family)